MKTVLLIPLRNVTECMGFNKISEILKCSSGTKVFEGHFVFERIFNICVVKKRYRRFLLINVNYAISNKRNQK